MIKIENVEVVGWEHAIRGMRNPKNSWDRSDSTFGGCNDDYCEIGEDHSAVKIGPNDHKLMLSLAEGGSVHAKYRRMIVVYADITAPLYWWSEYDTYKVGTVANSCSKMHKLLAKPFEIEDFSFDKLPGYKKTIKQFRPEVDEETEVWKKYDADYDVSNYGRIRHGTRILSCSLHKDGYIYVTIHGKQMPLHRLIAEKFIANPCGKKEVNHIDGNKQNNFCNNLEWVTSSENQKHAIDNNLQPKGLSTYKGKFSEEQREEIKKLWDSGASRREIAHKYNVSHTCINDIINDKYKYASSVNVFKEIAMLLVDTLNELRDSYFNADNEQDKKQIWYSIIQLLPSSYNQKRTVMLNYEVLHNMYYSPRYNHKLDEWREFCEWIKTLPYSELILPPDAERSEKE